MNQIQNLDKIENILYVKAIQSLSTKPRTEKEIYNKLKLFSKKLGLDDDSAVNRVIGRLTAEGLLNDAHYASIVFEQKIGKKNPEGPNKIINTLVKKGVSRDILKSGLRFDPEEEFVSCLRLAENKFSPPYDFDKKQKMKRFLYGRGFSLSCINRVVDTINKVN